MKFYVLIIYQHELDRLDLTHQLFRLLQDDKLYLCPLTNPAPRVLDVGTGTGIWAIELGKRCPAFARILRQENKRRLNYVGDELPKAEIIGTDLSPTQSKW